RLTPGHAVGRASRPHRPKKRAGRPRSRQIPLDTTRTGRYPPPARGGIILPPYHRGCVMAGRVWPVGLVLALAAGGCLPTGSESLLVSANPFDDGQRPRPATPPPAVHAPASEEAERRVLAVAEKV